MQEILEHIALGIGLVSVAVMLIGFALAIVRFAQLDRLLPEQGNPGNLGT